MNAIEIILLVAGVLVFAGSFFLPDKGKGEKAEIPEEELKRLVEEEIEKNKGRIDNMTEETVNYSMEKTERSLDRIANEKIMALGEYSDNVLNQIGNNHQEVVFLHEMLNRTKNELEDLLNRAERESKDANERANAAYSLAENARRLAEEVMEKTEVAGKAAVAAEEKMLDARRLAQDMHSTEQATDAGMQAKALEERVLAGNNASSAVDASEDVNSFAREKAADETPVSAQQQVEEAAEAAVADEPEDRMLTAQSYGASTEEELQALLDNAMNAAAEEEAAEPKKPTFDPMAVDPEEERFFEDTQEMEDEEDEDKEEELSEEEMMEKLLREATAELAHDVSWVSNAAVQKEKNRAAAKAAEKKEEKESRKTADNSGEDKEEGLRITARRKTKAKTTQKASGDDEIEGQMSIPEEFIPGSKSPVSLQFGHDDGNSANHNERILEMHRMGRSNMAIAKDLGLGIGEVKLVIDLFENV